MPQPESAELHPEGWEPWQIGEPLEQIDWLQSVIQSPRVISGLTTVQRSYGPGAGRPTKPVPVDLDMYVDSSGSMPDPRQRISYLALAGAIIALSALRAGSSVQVTLWSGKGHTLATKGFVRNEHEVLAVLTGFFGGGTSFPIHLLRETFKTRRAHNTHILMISDDGITTMFDQDEQGNDGWDISARALDNGGAGGTMALNMPADWDNTKASKWYQDAYKALKRARDQQGWNINAIARFEDLVEFAQAFSRRHYGPLKTPKKKHA